MRTMLLTAGLAAMLAQGTERPGEMRRPDVWVKNSSSEAIPIDLRDVHLDKPLNVVLVNGEPSSGEARLVPIRVRVVPPTWTYRTVAISGAADPAQALQAAGADGWETTGLSWPRGQDTLVLLKKAR